MKTFYSYLATLALLFVFGAVGSMELNRLSILAGLLRIIIYTAIFLFSLTKIKGECEE